MKILLLILVIGLLVLVACGTRAGDGKVTINQATNCPLAKTEFIANASKDEIRKYFLNRSEADLLFGTICTTVREDTDQKITSVAYIMADGRTFIYGEGSFSSPPSLGVPVVLLLKRDGQRNGLSIVDWKEIH